jgi:hypothetical protein
VSTSTLPSKAWTRIFGSSTHDWARALTIEVDGAIYVGGKAGESFDGYTSSGGEDAFLIKYDANGTQALTRAGRTGVRRSLLRQRPRPKPGSLHSLFEDVPGRYPGHIFSVGLRKTTW